jgi:hypothetical protein
VLDFLSLGALVHWFDPGIIPFRKAAHCDIHVSGGDFNVSANLSHCFRLSPGSRTPARGTTRIGKDPGLDRATDLVLWSGNSPISFFPSASVQQPAAPRK